MEHIQEIVMKFLKKLFGIKDKTKIATEKQATIYLDKGLSFLAIGAYDFAIALFREAIALKPDYASAYNNLGIALKNKGQLNESIQAYRQAIALKPDFVYASYNNLGLVLVEKEQLDEAIKVYRQAINIKPDDAKIYIGLGNVFEKKGQYDEAIQEYRHALRIKPEDALVHYNLGIVLIKKGLFNEAINAFQQAIAIKPSDADTYYNLGFCLGEKGLFDEAIKAYQQAITIKPNYFSAYYNLGLALSESGKLNEAINSFNNYLKYAPSQDKLILKANYQIERLNSLKEKLFGKDVNETKIEIFPGSEYNIGDRIGGKYKIYRILGGEGKSGMGIVYICLINDQKVCALKTFQAKYLCSKEMKDSFKREALAWVNLEKHPYIVRAVAVEELDYRLFIVLDA